MCKYSHWPEKDHCWLPIERVFKYIKAVAAFPHLRDREDSSVVLEMILPCF